MSKKARSYGSKIKTCTTICPHQGGARRHCCLKGRVYAHGAYGLVAQLRAQVRRGAGGDLGSVPEFSELARVFNPAPRPIAPA